MTNPVETAAPTPEPSAAPPSVSERIANAMAKMEEMSPSEPAADAEADTVVDGEPPSDEPAVEAAPEGDAETPAEPSEDAATEPEEDPDDLEVIARKGRERRLAAQREQQESQQTSESEASYAAKKAELDEAVSLFETDPVAFLEKNGHKVGPIYERLTKMALDADKVRSQNTAETALEEVERLKKELKAEREAKAEQAQQEEVRARYEAAAKAFTDASADKAAYPLLGRLDPKERVAQGVRVATTLREAGEENPTLARVAELAEKDLAKKYRDAWADLGSGSEGSETAAKGGRTKPGTASAGPKTITAQIASESAGTRKATVTARDRVRNATALAEKVL